MSAESRDGHEFKSSRKVQVAQWRINRGKRLSISYTIYNISSRLNSLFFLIFD